ncbi:uncharacterized protein Charon [Eurosta solidaginis]|uniref:uncharacterized protein Charon n=1 Tax=Eurosta solidaginis TaxID=178769 RepID=UPI00353102B8
MKKAILTKIVGKPVESAIKITNPHNHHYKLAYAELFRAVLQIPEKDIQVRILNAINGKSSTTEFVNAMCPTCKQTFGTKPELRKTISTQTDITEIVSHINNQTLRLIAPPVETILSSTNSSTNSDDSHDRHSPILQKSVVSTSMTKDFTTARFSHPAACCLPTQRHQPIITRQEEALPTQPHQQIKRKRKRKVCLPQVMKRSHAQMVQTHLQPKLKIKKVETIKGPGVDYCMQASISNCDRRDSIGPIPLDDWIEELFKEPDEHKSKEEHIMRIMAEECLDAEKRTDGLLAIHRSIVANDLYALRRQIFVWRKLRKLVDLNELLTDEDENCLQLAIIQDCFPKVINILLNEGLNVNEVDYHSNTCIHLAILNEVELESLSLLMQKIDLKLLLHLNDDGYTPLHIAVRTDSYLRAEIIIRTLDERLGTKPILACNSGRVTTKDEFQKYYEDVCRLLEKIYSDDTTRNAQPKFKKKLLEAGDRKSGNTPLFFALENKLEHLVFFLLAHLTDPRIINFSGQDARSYYWEFGKTLNLSLKVDNAMENAVSLLRY